ncbi:DNA polymerase-3 subunit epsilon [Microbacterium pygmaeum]|uniref:DNA polymerase-3 subunit epsilon n=2 Tax=Microbacterium pygmaeum TaxID=370764 RepID=A0A1G8B9L9_9MICO|nr:DNA polymerase-3 subunit epsilon [Microbacterium pygmaeum]
MSEPVHTVNRMQATDSPAPADDAPPGPPGWTRVIGVFDLETTGVDVTSDRIVTAHVGLLDAKGSVILARDWVADPGVEIPDSAAAIHGITTEHARAVGEPAADVVEQIVDVLRSLLDAGIPIVAYNAAYDFSLLSCEAQRHGIAPLRAPSPVIDPLILDKTYDRYRRGKRTLAAVAEHYAVRLDDAHHASADAVAAGRVAQALAQRFAGMLPPRVDELHTRQIAWARAQAASLTEYFIRIGRLDPEERLDGGWPVR